jgi:hypothetical protein
MRDPARIEVLLNALREAWLKDPDMRFGQLLVNHARLGEPCPEVFHLEDDQLLANIRDWMAKSDSGELHTITGPAELTAEELKIRKLGQEEGLREFGLRINKLFPMQVK